MPNWIGYRWLIDRYGLSFTQPLRVETAIGPSRSRVSDGTTDQRTVPESLRPEPTLAGHLTFAFKHEGMNLEVLSRLFTRPAYLRLRVRHSSRSASSICTLWSMATAESAAS